MKSLTSARLYIPEPCNESWDNMTDIRNGKYCNSCKKAVVDFTGMSDRVLLDYLKNNGFGCGRFKEDQLKRNLMKQSHQRRNRWAHISFGVIGFFAVLKDGFGQNNRLLASVQMPGDSSKMSQKKCFLDNN